MDKSPERKKLKIESIVSTSKRMRESENISSKRRRSEEPKEDIQAQKRKNFVIACEQVSYQAYFDLHTRLQIIYLPQCASENHCKHQDYKNGTNIREMPSFAEESFKIEMKTNMWFEALEVCQLCITPVQYLSANVLLDIVEIMMNAHEDSFADYSISDLIEKCQETLSQNFSTHPPCMIKSLRNSYNNFLTSPLDLKANTFSNRKLFGCDKGIIKYCMNRLEYEISLESKDEALIDKDKNIPEEMQQSVKGLHWQKEKFEIFEMLHRPDRIFRLMAVLESIIELLQFDLAIWHKRYTNKLGNHIMRSHRPLMAFILWSSNVLYTGAVNNSCRQILSLFAQFIHLQYPENHIRILRLWLNTIIQTFYICEQNSHIDYPNTGKYCTAFAKEFYKIIADMPHRSIIRILENIQPMYMRNIIITLHLQKLLNTKKSDTIKIFLDFLNKKQWEMFPFIDTEIIISENTNIKPRKVKNIVKYLLNKSNIAGRDLENYNIVVYPKLGLCQHTNNCDIDQNYIVHIMYLALEAYLDAYNVQLVQDKLDNLNEQLLHAKDDRKPEVFVYNSYSVSEHFIRQYRLIIQMLKELIALLLELKNNERLPNSFSIFEKILST